MEIQADRIILKPLGMKYLDSVNEYAMDKDNTTYMLFLPNDSVQDTINFLKAAEIEWEKELPAFYEFAIIYDGIHIGTVSLYPNDDRTSAEFGWIINKKYWNQGFAYEAACALLEYTVKELGIRHFIAHCDTENNASWRVMEKLGMKRVSEIGGRKNKQFDKMSREYMYELKI